MLRSAEGQTHKNMQDKREFQNLKNLSEDLTYYYDLLLIMRNLATFFLSQTVKTVWKMYFHLYIIIIIIIHFIWRHLSIHPRSPYNKIIQNKR